MPIDFLPSREADLVTWSTNFNTRVSVAPTNFGLTAAQATAYTALHEAFVAAYQAATDPGTNAHANIVIKNDAKQALIEDARELVRIIQAAPNVTNGQRAALGLNVRDVEPSPIPTPSEPPQLTIASTFGRTVTVRLRDVNNPDRRGKPDGVQGATVLSYVGETPPATMDEWTFERNTTRTTVDVEFPATVAPGAQVWLTAFWFNPRSDSGPACTPVSTNLQFGGLSQAA